MTKPKLEPGFKQFLIKTGIFVVLFITIQLIILILQTIRLPKEYYFLLDVDIGKALLLTAMIFFFFTRDKLKELGKYKFELETSIVFGMLAIFSFVGYTILKSFLSNNPMIAVENIWIFFPLKDLTLILGTIFLFIAVFGKKFSLYFVKKFKKDIRISIMIFALALFLIVEFQKLWVYFSYAVSKIVYFLLSLTFNSTLTFDGTLPYLGIINNFVVGIGKPCSGIDSMLMFIFLYVFITGYDWKVLNKKKLAIMFIPGIISVFLLNVIRIYLLITIGAFVSQGFAIGFFHTNASMILFLGYFILFWGLLYKWMKK
jgi:exosortase/archaeosortase family protein